MSTLSLKSFDLTDAQFDEISEMVRELCGINLHNGKRELVKARLSKRLRALGLTDFQQYMKYVRGDANELIVMLDELSTNLTSFFREPGHFEHLARHVLFRAARRGDPKPRLRIWSAGCSSGEEPYSVAIAVLEALPDPPAWDVRVLATDISTRMLEAARNGTYSVKRIESVPGGMRGRYLECVQARPQRMYRVKDSVRDLVTFARLNLMGPWPMKGPFDAIFCRNVMIYFDKPTQQRLIDRFDDLLAPGGTLYLGHSESLTGVRHRFQYVQPTVYEKPETGPRKD